jgi:hypothetical protein
MNLASILLWGFAATVALTALMAVSHGMGLTRMSIPFLLGTILTPNRVATWYIGAGIGFVHAVFVLAVGMPILPGLHPRMVSEYYGPTPNRQLQPPGFMALNYGRQTPAVTIVAHMLYGAIIGAFYELAH